MSAYLSNILTQTTSRYNTLRRTLLSNEDDGDTEDDSHISRVLRAYYTEKGRPFPPWLPPDPNDRRAITPQPYMQQSASYFGNKTPYSNVQNQPGQRSSLSDLWDSPSQQNAAPMQPQSLRNARRPMGGAPAAGNPSGHLAPPQARPLPSQRAGSYQSVASQRGGPADYDPGPPSSGGGTAQDRLKARLWSGNRAPSPSNSSKGGSAQNPYDQQRGGANQYDGGGRDGRYGRTG